MTECVELAGGFGGSCPTSSSLFGSTPALPTTFGAAVNPLGSATGFTLQKTPIGSKRGKNA